MSAKAIRKTAAVWTWKLWLPLAASLLLVNCSMIENYLLQDQAPTTATPEPEKQAAPAVAPAAKPVAKPKPTVPPRPSVVKPALEPQALVGLGEDDVNRLLGKPGELRNDPPAMVWQYVAGDCRLDLFFYLDLKSQDFRALAYSFDPKANTDGAKRACLDKIQEAYREHRN